MNAPGKYLVSAVEKIKKVTGLHTYQVEFLFVIIVLISILIIKKGSFVEIIGSLAVFFSFAHAKVANRLAEREAYRSVNQKEDIAILSYHHKTQHYFYLKEIMWFVYFILLGAWSALVGCIIFLLYEPWRNLWRKHHSLEDKLNKKINV